MDLEELLGPALTRELRDRLHASLGRDDRFRVLDDVIGRVVVKSKDLAAPSGVVEAWRCVVESRGTTTVEALALLVGWSRKHLASRFRSELGLSPKQAIRVVRFEAARDALLTGEAVSFAGVAAAAGFSDQAHMTREWRDLAGCTPAEWAAEELHDPPRGFEGA